MTAAANLGPEMEKCSGIPANDDDEKRPSLPSLVFLIFCVRHSRNILIFTAEVSLLSYVTNIFTSYASFIIRSICRSFDDVIKIKIIGIGFIIILFNYSLSCIIIINSIILGLGWAFYLSWNGLKHLMLLQSCLYHFLGWRLYQPHPQYEEEEQRPHGGLSHHCRSCESQAQML